MGVRVRDLHKSSAFTFEFNEYTAHEYIEVEMKVSKKNSCMGRRLKKAWICKSSVRQAEICKYFPCCLGL